MTLVDHVVTDQGVALSGDSRGILTPWQLRTEVWQWATDHGIEIEYQGSLAGRDLWYVRDDAHRAWFALRWS